MTEILLNAIIHVFSVFTFRRGKVFYPKARNLLEFYLKHYLGLSATCTTYLGLFDDFLGFYETQPKTDDFFDTVVEKIAHGLKKQLPRKEQYISLLLFADLAIQFEDARIDDVAVLAGVFSIPPDAVRDIEAFCRHPRDPLRLSSRFAVLADHPAKGGSACRTLVKPDFEGGFTLWHVPEIDGFFIKAWEKSRLLMQGAPLIPGRCYWMPPQASLHDHRWQAVTHSEIAALFREKAGWVVFEGDALDFRYPGSDNGLHRFSFSVKGGEMVAVMGGSGTGKSTLLGLLNGSIPPDSGRILFNGRNLFRHASVFQERFGYVPQDDLLFEDLTVYENLYYRARFCLAQWPRARIREQVLAMLKDLGQLDAKDLKVGSPLEKTISGGQRKRLNIALELIREPSILFVDEPTSGLSSSDSETVMSLLKAQAIKGNLVFVVIHQPSSRIFKLFDRLWILDKGGRPVYDGNPLDGLVYFQSEIQKAGMEEYACPQCGNVNPEQIFAILEARKTDEAGQFTDQRKISPREWHRRYLEKIASKPPEIPSRVTEPPADTAPGRPGLWEQFGLFFIRNLKSRVADTHYLCIDLLEPLILALFIGILIRGTAGAAYTFRDNTNVAVFFFISVIVSVFLGLSVSAEEINRDRKILVQEQFLGLSRFAYICAKTVYMALVCAAQTALYVGVANTVVQVPGMYGATFWTLFSCGMAASLVGLNISAALARLVYIYILIPMLLIPQMLLSGVVIDFDQLIKKDSGHRFPPLAADLMPSRWGVEALLVRQFTANAYMARFFEPESQKLQSEFMNDDYLPELHALADFIFLPEKPENWEMTAGRNLAALGRETRSLSGATGLENPLSPGDFTLSAFDREKWRGVKKFLGDAEDFYTRQRRDAVMLISRIKKSLSGSGKGISAKMLKDRYTNVSVEHLALNEQAPEPVRRSGERLVQVIYPVCHMAGNSWGRAHFMAPEKRVGPVTLSTYAFNCTVLWLMCLVLFGTLYANLLSRAGRLISGMARPWTRRTAFKSGIR